MNKYLHKAKANILRHKSASLSLFMIIMLVSSLITVGLSVLTGIDKDYKKGHDRLNSMHSLFIFPKHVYNPVFEEVLKNDTRVSQYEINEVPLAQVTLNYGGQTKTPVFFYSIEKPVRISGAKNLEKDNSVSPGNAVYLPNYAKQLGIKTEDTFELIYINKPIKLTVAGFFESNDFSTPNSGYLKFFVSGECFEYLKDEMNTSVFITVRFFDPSDSIQFNDDFVTKINLNVSDLTEMANIYDLSIGTVMPVTTIVSILTGFALLLAVLSFFVLSFRIKNNINGSTHEIGVLKASGYTSSQIVLCYLIEYGIILFTAAIAGIFAPIPLFSFIRTVLSSVSGFTWTISVNVLLGLISAFLLIFTLLIIVRSSCRKIKQLPPVIALKGEMAANSFRKNFVPLGKGAGSVNIRLGFKNSFAFMKVYVTIGFVIMLVSMAVTFITPLYENFVLDPVGLVRMAGLELSDLEIRTTRHTDSFALGARLEAMPEVRKTSMLDMWSKFEIDRVLVMSYISNDFTQMESMTAYEGRFPRYDNEIAIPKNFSDRLGKSIGDSVTVKAAGVSLEYIITGFFSTTNNMGNVGAILLEGFRRLDPNYKLRSIFVYLNEGIEIADITGKIKQNFGMLNVHTQQDGKYSAAKARAQEKIAEYFQHYNIDSVEYAVIYNGEIILSGSSGAYQIEEITDMRELTKAMLGTFSGIVSALMLSVMIISLIIIVLTLSMTIRTVITKRRREFGIMKASGFTVSQLTGQLIISFLPSSVTGVIIGCIAGALAANPVLSSLFYAIGAYGSMFVINPLVSAIECVLILIITLTVVYILAMKIKKISVYELISE